MAKINRMYKCEQQQQQQQQLPAIAALLSSQPQRQQQTTAAKAHNAPIYSTVLFGKDGAGKRPPEPAGHLPFYGSMDEKYTSGAASTKPSGW